MTLRQRLDRLEAAKPREAETLTPEMRSALDRLRAAKAQGDDAEAEARLELKDMLTDMHL
ncbi:MAG: hypothetical protein ACFE0P_08030 [Oceanicaulis sp.]